MLDADEVVSEEDASMHGAGGDAESEPVDKPRNVSGVAAVKRGDVAAAPASSDVVIKPAQRGARGRRDGGRRQVATHRVCFAGPPR